MRDFFINTFEVLVGVIVVLMCIGVVVGAGIVTFAGNSMGPDMPGGPLMGAAILLGGAIYVIFIAGFMYLGLGIYQNTKRTAEAIERLSAR
ncbi:MAG: hypothetical protein K0B00_00965 [Rhodobacteraceae bacterium]|nr:hypothetical protein [Paracoccaceae bacterium]